VFVAIVVLLLAPKGDLAYLGALAFALIAACGIVAAAMIKFAILPAVETFPAFCAAMALFFIPVGFAAARSRTPAPMAVFGGMAVAVMRLLSPTNPMIYDTEQFYNTAMAVFVGSAMRRWHFVCCRRSRRRCGRADCSLSPCATCGAWRLARCRRGRRIGNAGCTTGLRHCQMKLNRYGARSCWRRCQLAATSISLATRSRALG
jgi:hypothetical protein